MSQATILHADLDAFYASVEQVLEPSLRGVPMAVGAGVVLAASYEARAFGVHSAMSITQARRMCPRLVVVPGSFSRYLEFSDRVMAIFERFTPDVEQISIDEAFLDVRRAKRLFGTAPEVAVAIRRTVLGELGLALSIGVSTTKWLSKVASKVAKPDGLIVVNRGQEEEFLAPLPIEYLWGVGPVTAAKLRRAGIETVGDLAVTPVDAMTAWLGRSAASHLAALAANRDPRPVRRRPRAKSIGSQRALGRGLTDLEELDRVVASLAERVGRRLRAKGRTCRTITVRARFPEGRLLTRSQTLPTPAAATAAIEKTARRLLRQAMGDCDDPVTLVGIALSGLENDSGLQLELGWDTGEVDRAGTAASDTALAIDRQVDEIRRRFGVGAITRAGLIGRDDTNAPDDFRRLAERD